MEAPRWVRVITTVAADRVDLIADALWSAGCAGIEEQPAGTSVRLLAGFDDPRTAAAAVDALLPLDAIAELVEVDLDALDDDLDAWRRHAHPERAGTFWIVPSWLEPPDAVDPDDVLLVDSGRTFGSGSHPTTRLVLALVDRDGPGRRVLDVGSGSGILAIGAARRGASQVVAIDVDPAAPETTRANAERNGVADVVDASHRALAEIVSTLEPFDLVLANLLAPIVRGLAADLAAATAPDGRLIVSGLLAARWQEATAALDPMLPVEVQEADGWVAVELRHPPSPVVAGERR